MGILIIMAGAPGSGKSTYLKSNQRPDTKIISRDSIRFSMLQDNNKYFDKETLVFNTFVIEINQALKEYEFVYADATHITPASRRKLMNRINRHDCLEFWAIAMNTPLERCQINNAKRTGRARVPAHVIDKMYNNFIMPTRQEGFSEIITINWEENTV